MTDVNPDLAAVARAMEVDGNLDQDIIHAARRALLADPVRAAYAEELQYQYEDAMMMGLVGKAERIRALLARAAAQATEPTP